MSVKDSRAWACSHASVCGVSEGEWPDFVVAQKRLLLASPFHRSTARLKERGKMHWEWGWAACLGGMVTLSLLLPTWGVLGQRWKKQMWETQRTSVGA
jgi:hypothetical protein